MKRFSAFLALVCALVWVPLRGELNDVALQEAHLAWDRGDYVAALTAYSKLLTSSESDALFESIALQTGGLYATTELTTDGNAPRFSPDGRHITYETGSGLKRRLRVVTAESAPTLKAEVPGFGASFSPDSSQIAYFKVIPTPELEDAHAAMERATPAERPQRLTALNLMLTAASRIAMRDVASGTETEIELGGMRKSAPLLVAAGGIVLFAGGTGSDVLQIYSVDRTGAPRAMTTDAGEKVLQEVNEAGTEAIVTVRTAGAAGRGAGAPLQRFGILTVPDGAWTEMQGTAASFAADGQSFAYVTRADAEWRIMAAPTANASTPTVVRKGIERMDAPALSRDGTRIAFQLMPAHDWELVVSNRDGTGERRVTREIQHDLLPRFLTVDRLLGTIGEARHRRSYIYDLPRNDPADPATDATGSASADVQVVRRRLFHNNTVRTIAPEYIWVPNAAGTRVLISAERDGDTVSPERGIYLVDLSRRITRRELHSRVSSNLSAEEALIAKGKRLFAGIAAPVRNLVNQASVSRVFAYEKALYDFGSKHVSQPGNKLASMYLFDTYKSFGYEPQYQWFEGRGALGGQTANVIATLKGTMNPELVYVVSSHYDSVPGGPGADDDSSGTAALLETARLLARHPQPATIIFASFTGEESGLLGSREFVRRAVADKVRVLGALNNDMIGWANDHRLDNTIRYSNPGIRDIQHAAAMHFTQLITYDALYYKGTDAAAYYDAYGDIVGGIGSYPVLGNPHYHQPHDVLETINHQLVTEVAKTTAATLMLLAASPSRLPDLKVESYANGTATLSWTASPETGVTGYIVAYGSPNDPEAQRMTVKRPGVTLKVAAGSVVAVKAVNAKGLEGWDWARVTIR